MILDFISPLLHVDIGHNLQVDFLISFTSEQIGISLDRVPVWAIWWQMLSVEREDFVLRLDICEAFLGSLIMNDVDRTLFIKEFGACHFMQTLDLEL